jgi:hypothetical protein
MDVFGKTLNIPVSMGLNKKTGGSETSGAGMT